MLHTKAVAGIILLFLVCAFMLTILFFIKIGGKYGILSIRKEVQIPILMHSFSSEIYSLLNFGGEKKNIELFGYIYAGHKDQNFWESVKNMLNDILKTSEYEIFIDNGANFRIGSTRKTSGYEAEIPIPGAGKNGKIKGKVVVVR